MILVKTNLGEDVLLMNVCIVLTSVLTIIYTLFLEIF